MVISLRGCEGRAPDGFPGNWWATLTSLPSVNGRLRCGLPAVCGGVSLRDLCFCCERAPWPIIHWRLCCGLWAPSLVLRLRRYKACRPVGCSPIAAEVDFHLFLELCESRSTRPGPPASFLNPRPSTVEHTWLLVSSFSERGVLLSRFINSHLEVTSFWHFHILSLLFTEGKQFLPFVTLIFWLNFDSWRKANGHFLSNGA